MHRFNDCMLTKSLSLDGLVGGGFAGGCGGGGDGGAVVLLFFFFFFLERVGMHLSLSLSLSLSLPSSSILFLFLSCKCQISQNNAHVRFQAKKKGCGQTDAADSSTVGPTGLLTLHSLLTVLLGSPLHIVDSCELTETDTKGRPSVVDVSINWAANRNWQVFVAC